MNLDSRAVRWALVFTVVVVAQVAVASRLEVSGVHPDLLLLLAVTAGLTGGPARGAVVGFAAGVVADLYLHTRFGVGALASTLTGYAAGVAGDTVVRPSTTIWALSTAALSAAARPASVAWLAPVIPETTSDGRRGASSVSRR